jgi:hypothetical protein
LVPELIDTELKRALELLDKNNQRQESRQHAAVLVLGVLAEKAPAIFYIHVEAFILV